MSHDTSRHTERADVICNSCGRKLRGALNHRGKWVIGKHKKPDGTGCLGHYSTSHRKADDERKDCPSCGQPMKIVGAEWWHDRPYVVGLHPRDCEKRIKLLGGTSGGLPR